MKINRRLFSLLLIAFAARAQYAPLRNPGFEEGSTEGEPAGWHSTAFARERGFSLQTAAAGCKQGQRCALLSGPAEPPKEGFGNVVQSVDASAYRNKVVRLSAEVRVEGRDTRAQMWLRLDRDDKTMVQLENMGSRPITSSEWRRYEIVMPVSPDTATIVLGVMQFGTGKAWVDDVRLEVVADFQVEPPRPLTSQGLRNLTAFTRLYGYVRFFHPSDQAAAIDWQTFALEGVRETEPAANDQELVTRLRRIFAPVAPTVQIYPRAGETPPLPDALKQGSAQMQVRHHHSGVQLPETAMQTNYNIYKSQRTTSDQTGPLMEPYRAEIVSGVMASVPQALYTGPDGTLPHVPKPEKRTLSGAVPLDRATRLADIVIAWNVFQHFYPYFDVVKTDWAAELNPALESAATDKTVDGYARTLRRLVAALKDGHGSVYGPGMTMNSTVVPYGWDWIDGQAVVTRPGGELAPGDRILGMDGVRVDKKLAELRPLISAAGDGLLLYRAIGELSRCPDPKRALDVEVEPWKAPGTSKTLTVACVPPKMPRESPTETRPGITAEVEPGIFYVDLERITMPVWKELTPKLETATGLIFDMRGYPNQVALDVLARLASSGIRSARWNVPRLLFPDRQNLEFVESGWPVPPISPRLTAPTAFLIDGRAISYAETVMGMVEHFKLGTIVGQPTAGTNGNVNPFRLPSGFTISWTGMKVLKHDQSQHHAIGIHPQVPVKRTRQGVAEGKDEILLRGIQVVKAGKN